MNIFFRHHETVQTRTGLAANRQYKTETNVRYQFKEKVTAETPVVGKNDKW